MAQARCEGTKSPRNCPTGLDCRARPGEGKAVQTSVLCPPIWAFTFDIFGFHTAPSQKPLLPVTGQQLLDGRHDWKIPEG